MCLQLHLLLSVCQVRSCKCFYLLLFPAWWFHLIAFKFHDFPGCCFLCCNVRPSSLENYASQQHWANLRFFSRWRRERKHISIWAILILVLSPPKKKQELSGKAGSKTLWKRIRGMPLDPHRAARTRCTLTFSSHVASWLFWDSPRYFRDSLSFFWMRWWRAREVFFIKI